MGARMPRGPQGQKRPVGTVECAVIVAKIATGEIEENPEKPSGRTRSGRAGASARAESLSPNRRSEIAKAGAASRWSKHK
jgi:hypothetical protein